MEGGNGGSGSRRQCRPYRPQWPIERIHMNIEDMTPEQLREYATAKENQREAITEIGRAHV